LFFFIYLFVLSLVLLLLLLFGKNDIFKITLIFIYLINGTVLGRALWDANTFPTRNRLPNPYFGLQTISFLFGFSMVFYNKLWWRLQYQFKYFLKIKF